MTERDWTGLWPGVRHPALSYQQHTMMLEAWTAWDVTVVGSSFIRNRPGVHCILVEDGAAERTYRVVMARHMFTGLWGMSCSCDDSLLHHPSLCKHSCHLLLRVLRLKDPMIYIEAGGARQAAVRLLLQFMGNRVALRSHPLPREDVPPPDPTDECPVCYEEFSENPCVRCGRCGHLFHRACAARWARSCPTCRDPRQFTDLAPTFPRTRWYPETGEVVARWDRLPSRSPSQNGDDEVFVYDSETDSGPLPEVGEEATPRPPSAH